MFKKKLGSILSSLTSKVRELDAYIAQSTEDLGENEIKIAQLESKRDDMANDIAQASTVSNNLKVLLNMEQ